MSEAVSEMDTASVAFSAYAGVDANSKLQNNISSLLFFLKDF